ncbi:MAG: hypothetical protein JWQ14_2131 [Adhaeribacter sp.]|nr:hypothetical protein [Adhaeribacter sp.]
MDNSDDYLEIPVTYKGQELSFPAKFLMSGYNYKIQVEVEGQLIMFEVDEERKFRALLNEAQLQKGIKVDVALLQVIAIVLESVVK